MVIALNSVCPSAYLYVFMFAYLPACMSACLSICLSVRLSPFLSVRLALLAFMPDCLPFCPCACLSISLSTLRCIFARICLSKRGYSFTTIVIVVLAAGAASLFPYEPSHKPAQQTLYEVYAKRINTKHKK